MNVKEFENLIPDYILGKLTEDQDVVFAQYVNDNPEALDQWHSLKTYLNKGNLEPSARMDLKFYEFLNTEKDKSNTDKVKPLVFNKNPKSYMRFVLPLAAASMMLFFGFFIGKQWNTNTENEINIVDAESVQDIMNETDIVRTQLVMSLAEQPSASKRLQALSEATKLDNATEQVILALFKMLNADTNVNVRLAAVASLSKYVDNPKVREGLVLSITKQDSPLVQIALADLMVTLKEQKSINSMETLLQKPDINSAVKQKLEESIKQII